MSRWAWAEIDHDAIRHNVEVLCRAVSPSAVWAVVKADGYGHGAIDVARSALAAGADGLCVALADEGVELRAAGIDAPILLLSEQPLDEVARIGEHHLTPTVYTRAYVEALAALDLQQSDRVGIDVHLKIDTGMHRVGVAPQDAPSLAEVILRHAPRLRLGGVATHLASADDVADPATTDQLATFEAVLAALPANPVTPSDPRRQLGRRLGPPGGSVLVRASRDRDVWDLAGARRRPPLPRAAPGDEPAGAGLVPSSGSPAGSRISYGLRHRSTRSTTVATVPIGYADGVPRRPVRDRRRGARRRPPPPDRRRRHDGSTDGRRRRRSESRSATKWC